MRTSTFDKSSQQTAQSTTYSLNQHQTNKSSLENTPPSLLQQLFLSQNHSSQIISPSAASSSSSTKISSTSKALNQLDLLLLKNQLTSQFQNGQRINTIQKENSSSNLIFAQDYVLSNERDSFQEDSQSSVDEQVELQEKRVNKSSRSQQQEDSSSLDIDSEDRNDIHNNNQSHNDNIQEKNRTFSFNSNVSNSNSQSVHFQEQEHNLVTRQQLLLGLMGLEQQLKKLQEQSQQKHSISCGSSTTSNQRNDEEENLSPVSRQQHPQFVSFCNIPNVEVDVTPRKRSSRIDSKLQSQKLKEQSICGTPLKDDSFSNCDILTTSKRVNVVNGGQAYSHHHQQGFGGSDLKNTSMNILSSYKTNYLTQYNDINEFCLEDDDENPKIETSTMSESKSREFNKIKDVIYFIVNALDKDEEDLAAKRCLIQEDERFAEKKSSFLIIFDKLIKKFKHLKKTKEEKTKFCMRKAFRYLFAQLKMNCNSKMNLKEANEICMKHYFSQHVNDSQFVLPFRRNSSIKTMNAAFLKKVFASSKFVQDYRDFLNYFDRLALDDNSKKVDQLAYYILPMLEDSKFEIEGLRRLPWTMNLLDSTRVLAFQLLEFEENPINGILPCLNEQQQPYQENANSPSTNQQTYTSSLQCANQYNEENLSNIDTLSIQTQNRKISESYINVDVLSRKLSISSSDSQHNNSEVEYMQIGDSNDQHIQYLKQISHALIEFQQSWSMNSSSSSQSIQKIRSKEIKREVIVLTPPLYDLNENPHKKFQLNTCQ